MIDMSLSEPEPAPLSSVLPARAQMGHGTPSLGDTIAALAFFVTLALAWLYMVGWIYAYYYYDRFRVGLLTLNIPREYFFVYGFWVLTAQLFWVVPLLTIGAIVGATMSVLLTQLSYRPRWPCALFFWTGICIVPLLFWLGYHAAIATANTQYIDDRVQDYRAYPRVRVWVDPAWSNNNETAQIATGLAEGCYRLLFRNTEDLILFRSFAEASAAELPLLALPRANVRTMRIISPINSCQ